MKLGCRINASAVDAYTIGNILFQTLKLTPIQAAFEHLVLSYADVAYQYQANTAEYCDKSHAAYYGRSGSPLDHPNALGGLLDTEPGAAHRGDSHARRSLAA